jgi:hypothetical protein
MVSLARHRAPHRDFALLWHQIRYEQLSFWRNPRTPAVKCSGCVNSQGSARW